jgi:hypothetical protein
MLAPYTNFALYITRPGPVFTVDSRCPSATSPVTSGDTSKMAQGFYQYATFAD